MCSLIDERDPPELEALAARIVAARGQGRSVAAHCVTAAELALYLAALDLGGRALPGDRIEHGGSIPAEAIGEVHARGLTVVTNPAFLHDRGDRYLAEVPEAELPDLYRARSLLAAGIELRAGSDAPYASVDPWLGMRAARDRMTLGGRVISPDERIDARAALGLYAGGKRVHAVGAPDLAQQLIATGLGRPGVISVRRNPPR